MPWIFKRMRQTVKFRRKCENYLMKKLFDKKYLLSNINNLKVSLKFIWFHLWNKYFIKSQNDLSFAQCSFEITTSKHKHL